MVILYGLFVFKQKTAYELRISDWSSDVCSSDLRHQKGPNMQTSTYKPRIPEMNLYVPTPGTLIRNHIRQGSAVVGLPRNDGHIHCYYEGGVSSETIFADRLSSACGRLSEKAPTTAFAFVKEDDLQLVGTVNWDAVLAALVIYTVVPPDLFTDWTGNVPAR